MKPVKSLSEREADLDRFVFRSFVVIMYICAIPFIAAIASITYDFFSR